MGLIAWRTTGKNPSENPPVHISIASQEPGTDLWPWIIPLERAIEIFGHEVVDEIREEPVEVSLSLSLDKGNPATSTT